MTGRSASATVSRMIWMLSASSRSRCVNERICSLQIPTPGPSGGAQGAPRRRTDRSSVLFGLRLGLLRFCRPDGGALDRVDQRLEAIAIFLPALDRGVVDGLADLGDAGGLHRPVRLMEIDAFVVPREP